MDNNLYNLYMHKFIHAIQLIYVVQIYSCIYIQHTSNNSNCDTLWLLCESIIKKFKLY